MSHDRRKWHSSFRIDRQAEPSVHTFRQSLYLTSLCSQSGSNAILTSTLSIYDVLSSLLLMTHSHASVQHTNPLDQSSRSLHWVKNPSMSPVPANLSGHSRTSMQIFTQRIGGFVFRSNPSSASRQVCGGPPDGSAANPRIPLVID